jgi:DNA primase
MPYVPPELKERIKREISIQRLAEARGIKLRRSGKELIGLCPFHQDRNPSLNIDPVHELCPCLRDTLTTSRGRTTFVDLF